MAPSLRRAVESGGVFRLDEIEIELRLALEILRRRDLPVVKAPLAFAFFKSAINSMSASIARLRIFCSATF